MLCLSIGPHRRSTRRDKPTGRDRFHRAITMKWRQIGLVGAVLATGVFAGWHALHGAGTAQAAGVAPQAHVPVTTAKTGITDVPIYLDGLGTVQAYNIDEIKAQVNGILIALPVHEGQEVKQGGLIAEIDPTPYRAAVDQAVAQRTEDAAQLQSARLDLLRYQNLAKRSFAPVQQVDDQQASVNKLAAAVQLDNAAIETAQFNLNNCTIRAPISGRVGFYQTDIGNLIEVGGQTGIVSITQDKPIAVVFTLPESELEQIQTAMAQGKVPVEAANSQDSSKILGTGTLLTPNNTISTATGTISLKATFDNPNDRLWPGQFVNTRGRHTLRPAKADLTEIQVGMARADVKTPATVRRTRWLKPSAELAWTEPRRYWRPEWRTVSRAAKAWPNSTDIHPRWIPISPRQVTVPQSQIELALPRIVDLAAPTRGGCGLRAWSQGLQRLGPEPAALHIGTLLRPVLRQECRCHLHPRRRAWPVALCHRPAQSMKSRDIAPNSIPRAIQDRAAALVAIGDAATPPVAPRIFPTPSPEGHWKIMRIRLTNPMGARRRHAVPVVV